MILGKPAPSLGPRLSSKVSSGLLMLQALSSQNAFDDLIMLPLRLLWPHSEFEGNSQETPIPRRGHW